MDQQPSYAHIARQVFSLMLWVTRRLLRVLLRRPVIDVLLLLLVLYLIASIIGRFNQPQEVLYPEPPTMFEGR
jgi:hypothetical protein